MQQTIYRRDGAREGPACRLVAVGDLMLSGEVARRYPAGAGADRIFRDVAGGFGSADIVFGNLETPLCDPPEPGLFRGDPALAPLLAGAGFTILSLANNHVLEYGPEGLRQCADLIEACGIRVLGAGLDQEAARRPVILEKRGLRVGFLGFGRTLQDQKDPRVPGFAEWDEELALRSIAALRSRVDCVVISVHIGFMWIDYPSPVFKTAADRLLEAGAHVVLMHHAHVLQGYLAEDGRLAVYNLGNFIADIREGETGVVPVPDRQRESAIFLIDLDRRGVAEVAIVPIVMTDDLRVTFADEDRARRIASRVERIAAEVRSGTYLNAFARQRAELNTENTLVCLLLHVKKGHWRELMKNLLKIRPEHVAMLWRFAWSRMSGWKKRGGEPGADLRSSG